MLIYSMSVSVDGFIADRAGAFGWTVLPVWPLRAAVFGIRREDDPTRLARALDFAGAIRRIARYRGTAGHLNNHDT